ncbi:zinc metallopeptidase [Rubripirellula reticaptiva]|uniref:Putative neutral zinc metallopeptidase n=1 Tax=Rubripirellula reticaptiva TaxID=2528013 RepID=A0A5C6FCJ2_9BACT|nr:zinc metallopeptidase [Rubripirellula reticaptiva]TWU57359.1 putative neutral zinc metallopeptidase [Rubripirellula reticaptiva]
MSDPFFLLLLFGIPAISGLVSRQMRKRFVQFSSDPMPLTGQQAAERMLFENGITDVQVISTPGKLTDHYDPRNKTVNLSQVVFSQSNVAAVAVATHECGHAVQDATGYAMLSLRSKMVPMLKVSNIALPVLAFGGAAVSQMAGNHGTAILCFFALGLPALFSLITLPVEFNASRRALNWLEEVGIAKDDQYLSARKALFWAAMTYVVAALGAIIQALYFAKIFLGRGRH